MASIPSAIGWRGITTAVCMFGLGFVVAAFLLHLGMRNPQYLHADIRSEKLSLLQQWSGNAYSATFGSSHVHNGFDPRAFDRTVAGTPAQTRMVNLAIAGGSQGEQRMTALEFLHAMHAPPQPAAPSSPRACIVLLELAAGANFTNDHLVHPRAINIYDWPTAKLVTHLTSPEMDLRQRLGRIGYAWAAMALHYMNVGMLSSRIFPAPLDPQLLHDETIGDRRGLWVISNPPDVLAKIQKMESDSPQSPTVVQGAFLPGNRELVDELEDASPVRNLQMAYIVMPKISDLTQWTQYPDTIETAHGPIPVLNLARPDRYPQLYQPKLWFDEAHFNESGAQAASTALAEALQHWYAIHGQPAPCERR